MFLRAILLFITLVTCSLGFAETVVDDTIRTDSVTDSKVTTQSSTTTTLKSPPPSAISPTINTSNSDLCTFGISGAVQTQILGMSMGTQFTDYNCEKLKNAKTLYDMGMKVAAVSVMCQDQRVFDAMMNAGTPCPYDGLIGEAAKLGWQNHIASGNKLPETEKDKEATKDEKTTWSLAGVASVLLLLLLL